MNSQHKITQKEQENNFLKDFLCYYSKENPNFKDYNIINISESPDFIIEANKTKYAIEITEYFKGTKRKNRGSIEKIEFSKKNKLKEYIQSAYERKSSTLLNVNIIWSEYDFSHLDNKSMQEIADVFSEKLVEITQLNPPIIWAFNNVYSFVNGNILSNYISWINVTIPTNIQKKFFDFTESGYLEDPIPKLSVILTDKLTKLKTYILNLDMKKVCFDEFWLIIDANGRHITSTADFEKIKEYFPVHISEIEKPFEYTFDNVYIYDSCFRKFAKIK